MTGETSMMELHLIEQSNRNMQHLHGCRYLSQQQRSALRESNMMCPISCIDCGMMPLRAGSPLGLAHITTQGVLRHYLLL